MYTINDSEDYSTYEFTKNGHKLRVVCDLDTYFSGWTNNTTINLLFSVEEQLADGTWYSRGCANSQMRDAYTREVYPKAVKEIKKKLGKLIMEL